MWLLPQHDYTTTLQPTTQFYYATLYPSDQGSLLVSFHKSALDLHPKTRSSKHERGHADISLALTYEKHHEALTMMEDGLIGMPLL